MEATAQEAGAGILPALVGLGMTLVSVANWTNKFPDEAKAELTEATTTCAASLEKTVQKMRNQLVLQPDLRQSVIQFTNCIARQCMNMLDVEDWTHVLSACLLDGQHLRQFKEQLLQTNPGFLQSVELYQSC